MARNWCKKDQIIRGGSIVDSEDALDFHTALESRDEKFIAF